MHTKVIFIVKTYKLLCRPFIAEWFHGDFKLLNNAETYYRICIWDVIWL